MAYNITLGSSMRSNLLSLRNISTLMNKTQNILSTGKKVNSAIDNATSYYQARSLTNRASDLNSLLDSMSQGIQTIQAATQGIENGMALLEQVKALADETIVKNTGNKVTYADEIKKDISKQATVVSSASELINAINSGDETICVFGTIDLCDVTETIQINNNQKIVGIEYFGYEDSDVDKFSSIKATSSNDISLFTTKNVDCVFADLTIDYKNTAATCGEIAAIMISGGSAEIQSMDIRFEHSDTNNVKGRACIMGISSSVINTSGINYFKSTNSYNYGIRIKNSTINLNGIDNISTNGTNCRGIVNVGGVTNVNNQLYIEYSIKGLDGVVYGNTVFSDTSQTTIIRNNFNNIRITASGTATFNQGAKFAIGANETNLSYYEISQNAATKSSTLLISDFIIADYVSESTAFEHHNIPDMNSIKDIIDKELTLVDEPYAKQYHNIITAYNEIISDSSYQGVNLLNNDALSIIFNEDRTHGFTIKGISAKSDKIGISNDKWKCMENVKETLNEIDKAINNLRNISEQLGNKLTIIQTRQSFTEALSDILEEGADKLTLADMNEISAEYLMLQTRQQLAVNSLSLASQSAKSILSLF